MDDDKVNNTSTKDVLGENKGGKTRTMNRLPAASAGSDINFPLIMKAGLGLLVGITIISVLMWIMFKYFASEAKRSDPKLSPVATDVKKVPPEPRLQIAPVTDLKETQGIENAYLKNYGWVDESSGVVRIPIQEAKKLIIQKYKAGSEKPTRDDHGKK